MSGKLVSQLKDEETIENALKSCLENVRSMKSGAVLTEVLALLKNEEYAKDALSALANFLSNSSEEKKSMGSYFLKTLLKMKELIPEEIDVFVPFLKNQETKKDAWICVENLVSDTFGKAKKSTYIKSIAIGSEIPMYFMEILENNVDTDARSRAASLLHKILLKPNEKIFNELAKSILSKEKNGARTLVEIYAEQSKDYASVLARLCDIPECRESLCVAGALEACDGVLKSISADALDSGTLKHVCKILTSIICDVTLDDLMEPTLSDDEQVKDPCT